MKGLIPAVIIVAAVALRIVLYRRRRAARGTSEASTATTPLAAWRERVAARWGQRRLGDAGLVAGREVRERLRGRAFKIGTAVILLVVAAAIVIPAVNKSKAARENLGVPVTMPEAQRHAVRALGTRNGLDVRFQNIDGAHAAAALHSGRIEAYLSEDKILVEHAPSAGDNSGGAVFLRTLSEELGIARAYAEAKLSPAQAAQLARAQPLPVVGLRATAKKGAAQGTSVIGVILTFVMLTQYLTWTLTGVMEEKASRVVEVLLATVRPIQLLAGKVLGIGLVAMGQALLVLAFALAVAGGVGSTVLHGAAPLTLAASGLWLVLGYGFYCWVYATAGSMIERQDQVQSLALPLSLPMLVGYISSLTAAGTGAPNLFVKVLAFLPPTAPFAMPVLVGLSAVTWWEFVASALISVAATVAVARLAARLYRRTILRTGTRVPLRELRAGLRARRPVEPA